jgi:hypothetical protein
MANGSMTAVELFGKVVGDEHPDLLREAVRQVLHELMAQEVAERLGAGPHERTETRTGYRNGTRSRRLKTRVGEVDLAIPKLREGSYFPSFLTPRRPWEQALVSVIQEAYVGRPWDGPESVPGLLRLTFLPLSSGRRLTRELPDLVHTRRVLVRGCSFLLHFLLSKHSLSLKTRLTEGRVLACNSLILAPFCGPDLRTAPPFPLLLPPQISDTTRSPLTGTALWHNLRKRVSRPHATART